MHRPDNKPAQIHLLNGKQFMYVNGSNDSVNDYPSVIYPLGTRVWSKNNMKHRAHGLPAAVYNNGEQEYWYEGVQLPDPYE